MMDIRKANVKELIEASGLAIQMWSSHTVEELEQDFNKYIKTNGALFFIERLIFWKQIKSSALLRDCR